MKFLIFTIYFFKIIACSFEIGYVYYSRDNILNGIRLNNSFELKKVNFSFSKNTILIIHGFKYNSSSNQSNYIILKDELLKRQDLNIVLVDWSKLASIPDYFTVVEKLPEVGKEIANFLNQSLILSKKVHCIGHSLGAHVCGFIGKRSKLKRISGLDPAGPLFGSNSSERLDKKDAEFVDIIHTDSILGIQIPIGHADFYPNGGQIQPKCLKAYKRDLVNAIESSKCSHSSSVDLFIESIKTRCAYLSFSCNSFDDFLTNNCACNSVKFEVCANRMGFYAKLKTSNKTNEKYYLKTSKERQFCLF